MKNRKNLFIGLIVVAVAIAGFVMMPKMVEAEETVVKGENEIIFVQDSDNLNIQDYWANGKAPVRDGYVFAGWYSEASEDKYLTETAAAEATTAWAKFVPDYVLSVRAQIEAETKAADGATAIRVLSSVDTSVYQKVGFDIHLANKKQLTMTDDNGKEVAPLATNKAFTNILVNGSPVSATKTFGAASKYFVVWKLTEIADINDSKIIYVRPYWVTADGTTVYGLAKYVHVEDGYEGYINVPINLMTGEAIAAGIVKMTYPTDLEFVGFEEGRLLPVMLDNHATDGIIQMVGNTKEVDKNVSADGIYANLRFKKPETLPTEEDFTTTESDFCDWLEEEVTIKPIIQY